MTAKILIVDDLETNIKVLEAKLLMEYYTVYNASSGSKALELLERQNIDVILLDVMMPGMDGFETCRRIKANPETTHIPVVMVTALSDIEDRIKGLEAGADEFLTKPINDTSLFARVRSLSRMKTAVDELKLRNKTNAELGASIVDIKDNFINSKILLINDDIIQTRNLGRMMSKTSAQIQMINDPSEIDILNSYVPDLVIISCQLENGDPLRICGMLKSQEKLSHTVLMLLAEEENIPIVIKGMELGINDYFIYPVDENELLARLRTQLRRKQYQDDLRDALETSVNLSIKDALTGVFNRHYFDIHIIRMMKKAFKFNQQLCLMMFDIDYFKNVNDQYGHQAGDEILKIFTKILRNNFRVTDLISRYGGEEFSVLLCDTNLDQALIVAEKVRKKVEAAEFCVAGQKLPIKKTTSIGIAQYKNNEDPESFVKRADDALYEAKNTGRNKVVIRRDTII